MTNYLPFTMLAVLVFASATVAQESVENAAGHRFFLEKIEPLLKAHCFACHSHAKEMEGGLNLDSRSGWARGGDRGPAVVPGKPDASLMIKAVRRKDSDLQMPPDEKLPEAKVALLVEWIQRGAPDPRKVDLVAKNTGDPIAWWSLRPLQRPTVPPNQEGTNAIDAFVREQLTAKELSWSPMADRWTLIRRLYFNLHGLPPSPESVAAFLADSEPRAYEKLVDRLLESPRYGERWARHWLDTVHFADSHGCEHDVFRPHAWRYRDYVIDSFNRDTPWARFIREQLAADRFYSDETHLIPALGFLSAGPLELSRAGTAPVTFDYLDRDDMVTQTMAAFASTTANCARCHDHKFDPITQEDYYSLQAVFAGAGKGDVEFDDDSTTSRQRRQWNALLAATENGDSAKLLAPEYVQLVEQWEQKLEHHPVWEPLLPKTFLSSAGATLTRLQDNSLLSTGPRPDKDTYTITTSTALPQMTALRMDVLADESLPMHGPGRQDNGNLHLSEIEVFVIQADSSERQPLKIRKATADWNQEGWTINHALDGNEHSAWGIFPKVGQSHYAVFEFETPVRLQHSCQIVVRLKQLHGGGHLIGRVKLYAVDSPVTSVVVLPESVRAAINVSRAVRSKEQKVAIAAHVLRMHAEKQLAELAAPALVYAWSRGYSHGAKLGSPAMTPKVVHVLRRGDIHSPGEIAAPGALSVIQHLPGRFKLDEPGDEASRRAALADWLAAPENPLTWRSIVNRVWAYHFGRGLCDTPNDFGKMGGTPSHPELLDWLSAWFRDDAKGSLKQLHRLILLSSTWRQKSHILAQTIPHPAVRDPQLHDAKNRFLWRMNPRPLDAESFRDAILQISGRIDLTMGGPGIQQFTQSKGQQQTPKLDYGAFDWNHPSAARRSIYRVVWRGIADPFMESLDFPDLALLSPKRGFSVSALQALTVFNNDFVLHHSHLLSEKLKTNQASLDGQAKQACRLVFLRELDGQEHKILVAYARQHGLAALCRVLFNSNEFVFVD